MSLLWRDRLLIGVAPGKVSAIHLGRGWKPHIAARQEQTSPTGDTSIASAGSLVEAVVGTLDCRPIQARLVLSNHWVRYAVLPSSPNLKGVQERMALAELTFEERFGRTDRSWRYRIAPGTSAHPALACGIDSQLIDTIAAALPEGVITQSFQPLLMPAFNVVRRRIDESHAMLVIVEPGRLTWAYLQNGQWDEVVGRSIDPEDLDAPWQVLREFAAIREIPSGTRLWLYDVDGKHRPPAGIAWRVEQHPLSGRGLVDLLLAAS